MVGQKSENVLFFEAKLARSWSGVGAWSVSGPPGRRRGLLLIRNKDGGDYNGAYHAVYNPACAGSEITTT